MPQVYKQFTKEELNSRPIVKTSASDSARISTVLSNFVSYFKTQHLS